MKEKILSHIKLGRLIGNKRLDNLTLEEELELETWKDICEANQELYRQLEQNNTLNNSSYKTADEAWIDFNKRYLINTPKYHFRR